MIEQTDEFLHCYLLNGQGAGKKIDAQSLGQWSPEQGVLWVHLDVNDDNSRDWLLNVSGVQGEVADAMLAEETRPRSLAIDQGLLVVLRGVNTNPGADPEDMVSIRIWIEADRIITTRRRRILSVQDVRASLVKGDGPHSPGEFLAILVERLADRIGDFVDGIEEQLGESEDNVLSQDSATFRRSQPQTRDQSARGEPLGDDEEKKRKWPLASRSATTKKKNENGLWRAAWRPRRRSALSDTSASCVASRRVVRAPPP